MILNFIRLNILNLLIRIKIHPTNSFPVKPQNLMFLKLNEFTVSYSSINYVPLTIRAEWYWDYRWVFVAPRPAPLWAPSWMPRGRPALGLNHECVPYTAGDSLEKLWNQRRAGRQIWWLVSDFLPSLQTVADLPIPARELGVKISGVIF